MKHNRHYTLDRRTLVASVVLLVASSFGALAQVEREAKEKPPAEIRAIRVLPASLAGGATWTKLLVDFRTLPKWIDGMQISVTALCGDGSTERPYSILTGTVRYINVPRGDNTGVLFVSPKTTARYGGVTAAKADLYLNDRVVSSAEWEDGAKAPSKWESTYDRRDGALLPITATPWLAVEYDKYPDTLAGR
jgi:hypothetical protein